MSFARQVFGAVQRRSFSASARQVSSPIGFAGLIEFLFTAPGTPNSSSMSDMELTVPH
jgi:hypothetical protein